jgi:two-component system alkaline phosphatase synthesis response regulator PhoP
MKKNIFIVEDDEDIQQLVSYNLIKAGFAVEVADTGEQALKMTQEHPPDLIILDIMLPGMSGLEVCRTLRRDQQTSGLPVIMLTAKGEETDIVAGLDLGADDYLIKPFSPKVLISRVKAVLRRRPREAAVQTAKDDGLVQVHDLVIDSGRHEVRVSGKVVHLTPTEFDILRMLAVKPGWVFSRQQIIDAVRGYDFLVTHRAVDVQVFSLRKKLGEAGGRVETVRGIGYRFREN